MMPSPSAIHSVDHRTGGLEGTNSYQISVVCVDHRTSGLEVYDCMDDCTVVVRHRSHGIKIGKHNKSCACLFNKVMLIQLQFGTMLESQQF